jgi:hypothetical protein
VYVKLCTEVNNKHCRFERCEECGLIAASCVGGDYSLLNLGRKRNELTDRKGCQSQGIGVTVVQSNTVRSHATGSPFSAQNEHMIQTNFRARIYNLSRHLMDYEKFLCEIYTKSTYGNLSPICTPTVSSNSYYLLSDVLSEEYKYGHQFHEGLSRNYIHVDR